MFVTLLIAAVVVACRDPSCMYSVKLNPSRCHFRSCYFSFFFFFFLLLALLFILLLLLHSQPDCPSIIHQTQILEFTTLTIPRIHRSSTPNPNKPPHTHPPPPPQPSNTLPLSVRLRLFMRKRPQLRGSSILQPVTFCTHNAPKRTNNTSIRTNIHDRSQCRTRRRRFDTTLSPMGATSWW